MLQLEDMCRVLLTGFTPAGQGPVNEDGSASVRDPLPIGIGDQIRYYKTLFFRGDFDTTVSDSVTAVAPMTAVAQSLRTHCPQGHPYDEYNTVIGSDNKRRCRTCINARARARRADTVTQ